MTPLLLKTPEAAKLLGLSKITLTQYATRGNKLPFGPIRVGRAVRWPLEKIIAYSKGELCNDNGTMPDMSKKTGCKK